MTRRTTPKRRVVVSGTGSGRVIVAPLAGRREELALDDRPLAIQSSADRRYLLVTLPYELWIVDARTLGLQRSIALDMARPSVAEGWEGTLWIGGQHLHRGNLHSSTTTKVGSKLGGLVDHVGLIRADLLCGVGNQGELLWDIDREAPVHQRKASGREPLALVASKDERAVFSEGGSNCWVIDPTYKQGYSQLKLPATSSVPVQREGIVCLGKTSEQRIILAARDGAIAWTSPDLRMAGERAPAELLRGRTSESEPLATTGDERWIYVLRPKGLLQRFLIAQPVIKKVDKQRNKGKLKDHGRKPEPEVEPLPDAQEVQLDKIASCLALILDDAEPSESSDELPQVPAEPKKLLVLGGGRADNQLGRLWTVDPEALAWHLFMPCLDEAAVVERFVRRALALAPDLHLWAIDDHSDDDTLAILRRLAADQPRLHVVSRVRPEAQTGKGDALNAAYRQLDRWLPAEVDRHEVIVGVIDADGQLDDDALAMVAGAGGFGEPDVGAVQIGVRIANRATGDRPAPSGRFGRLLVDLQDLEFAGPIAAMQLVRGRTHSVSMGGNGQFTRMAVLDQIAEEAGTPWHGALLEDFELGLHVLLAGHETRYLHDVAVQQEGLPDLRRFVRQRSRWSQGSMQCRRYFVPIMRSPHLGNLAAFEASYFLALPWVQLVGFFVYLAAYVVLGYYLATASGGLRGLWVSGQWGVLPLLVLTGIGPFAIWGPLYRRMVEPSITRRRALLLGVANWGYSNLHYVATWWAFGRVVWARSDWKKTERVALEPMTTATRGAAPDRVAP